MITSSFVNSKPMIEPENVYGNHPRNNDICIVTFSKKVIDEMIVKYNMEYYDIARGINGGVPIYSFIYENKRYFAYMSPVTAASAAMFMDEIRSITGCHRYIVFGSCGSLNPITDGKLIVPTESYRDEGVSYHYCLAADYIEHTKADALAKQFDELNIDYVKGKNWTIEILYRETLEEVNNRKIDGCISVEMEASGLQALADYRDMELYTFFFAGDDLNTDDWSMANLGNDVEKENQKIGFEVALKVASRL